MTKTKAAVGQQWRDKDTRRKPFSPDGMRERVVAVREVDGHHATVVDRDNGRTSRIHLDEHGRIRGYALITKESSQP